MHKRSIITVMLLASTFLSNGAAYAGVNAPYLKFGEAAGNYAVGRYGNKTGMQERANDPITTNSSLKTLDDSKTGSASVLCGQGEIKDQKQALKIIVPVDTGDPKKIIVYSDTNGDGTPETMSQFDFDTVCINGYSYGGVHYAWQVLSTGIVESNPSSPLDGCVYQDTVPATYTTGKIAELFAKVMNRPMVSSSTKKGTVGAEVYYYSGKSEDCSGSANNITATKYYDNPYLMESDAMAGAASCTSGDMSCEAYKGMKGATTNPAINTSGSGEVSCAITRDYVDTPGPKDGIICEAGKVYYPNGYSETKQYCMTDQTTRWAYNSKVVLRCDSYGEELAVEGWGYWEGAPCKGNANHPPQNQLSKEVGYGTSFTNLSAGEFSVNRRVDDNAVDGDPGSDVRCVSDVNPLSVSVSAVCAADQSYCDYSISIANVPGCNAFTIRVAAPPGEDLSDTCQYYESQSTCRLKEEWAFDSSLVNKIQTVKDSSPVSSKLIWGYDASGEPILETCKTYSVIGPVCKDWWRKERKYDCQSAGYATEPDVTRPVQVMTTTSRSSDKITYNSPECTSGPCEINAFTETTVTSETCEQSCMVKFPAGMTQKGNSKNDYEVRICNKIGSSYKCPYTSATETLVKDCSCASQTGFEANSSLAISVMNAVYEATRDRKCNTTPN